MKIAILGSGPSLIMFKDASTVFDCVFFSNALIDKIDLIDNKKIQYFYIAHERRLLSKSFMDKISGLIKNNIKVCLGGDLYDEVSAGYSSKIDKFEDYLPENSLGKMIFDKLKLDPDLLRNVVTDYSIPLALTKNPTELHLFGCDFNYQYYKKNQNPEYALPPIGSFDHTIDSAYSWAKRSDEKYSYIKNILKIMEIQIVRHK